MLHAWENFGLVEAQREFTERWDHRPDSGGAPRRHSGDVLQGRISFVGMVRGSDDALFFRLNERYQQLVDRDLTPATGGVRFRGRASIVGGRYFNAQRPTWAVDAL